MGKIEPLGKITGSPAIKGFKQFISRGNVVDLAVGIVIGAGFSSIVNSFVKAFITPLIAVFFKAEDFSRLSFSIRGSTFLIGDFLNSLISFILIAVIVYFFVVLPMNTFMLAIKEKPQIDPNTKKCPQCLSDIPISAIRCSHCAQIIS